MQNIGRTHGFESLDVEGEIPDTLRGTLYRTGPVRQFINPIIQILPLHVAIVLGGMVGTNFGEDSMPGDDITMGVITVLVVGKTIVDLVRLLRE